MIDNRILEAEQELYQARLLAEKHQYYVSVNKSYRAVLAPAKATVGETAGVAVFDLRGVMCPLNYVKTKLKLEMMDAGERLEVWLDAGDPIKNVPMSLRNDGHKILAEEPLEPDARHFKVLVEKVEG